ncbi:MAG: TRAP transporter large permease, partial [Gammaproteobacteria bacterium]|nr:TRAP transporter large permease [Gammaproteobacteria bacterium]MDH5594879.1 TRAP transporter large permease [Gammaproteobacteria bacterium]
GGAPHRLIRLFNALVGWFPGGVAIVTIFSCAFFTAFTGASGVTIMALGGLLYPLLKIADYPERFATGILTASGSIGLLFPPSLVILLYAIVAKVNINELFLAGIFPGILLIVMLSIYSNYCGVKRTVTLQRFRWHVLGQAIKESAWDIVLPVIIIGSIFGGLITVAETAAVAAMYVLFVECIIYKEINLTKDLPVILKDTAILVGSILIILGVALGLTNLLIDAQLPMQLLAFLESYVDTPLGFLILLNIFLLLTGSIMDIFSAIVVIVPLILPLANRYGIDPVHLGIIFLANLEIGYITPPVGLNLFIASQRFGKPIMALFRAAIPFLMIMLVWLMLITYVPELSLWWKTPS